jgi:putative transposase
MAEDRRMTAAQVVDKLMSSEHADVVRESVAWMVAELMEVEVCGQIGAELGEVSGERVTQRNGYRPRPWDTRAGAIELAIPKLRQGSYFPSFLHPRRGYRGLWARAPARGARALRGLHVRVRGHAVGQAVNRCRR